MIQVKDKQFTPYITHETILERIAALAATLNADYAGKDPLFISILNGSFMFTADLLKEVTVPCEVSFIKLASYVGTSSSGKVTTMIGLDESIRGRHVVIVEDIIDTGHTLASFLPTLQDLQPASVEIAALLVKPKAIKVPLDIKYRCIEIPNDFIVGYGLDYDGYGRNLKDIYQVVS